MDKVILKLPRKATSQYKKWLKYFNIFKGGNELKALRKCKWRQICKR
jgi:hypothetical protein